MSIRQRSLIALFAKLILISGIISPQASSASDLCFSNLPDSAWENGQPDELPARMSSERISAKYVSTMPSDYFNYSKVDFELRYTYLGAQCAARTIVIKKQYVPKIVVLNQTQIDEYISTIQDQFKIEPAKQALKDAISLTSKSQIELSTDSKSKGALLGVAKLMPFMRSVSTATEQLMSQKNEVALAKLSWRNQTSFPNFVLRLFRPRESCARISYSLDKAPLARQRSSFNINPGFFIDSVDEEVRGSLRLETSAKSCEMEVLIMSFNNLLWTENLVLENYPTFFFQLLEEPIFALSLGSMKIVNVMPKPKTITCVKSSTIKRVRGLSPTCPKGFVQRK